MPDELTDEFLNSAWLLPVRIALIIIAAVIVRFIAHHMITKAVQTMVTDRSHPRRRTVPRKVAKKTKNGPTMTARIVATPGSGYDERRQQRIGALGSLGRSAVSIILLVIVGLVVLDQLGFPVATLLAGTSIIGIAVAFGVQTFLRDVISGIFMLIEDQIGMGDYIQISDVNGVVEDVGLRITQIRDDEGTVWYFRNGDISKVANYSQRSRSGNSPTTPADAEPENETPAP
ncbi:mechanosensitive ion channel [Microlunatus elymi]|uniref:Mechanosensitive ion channel n=1 Tax=Microlunatus elymi TaxID=2596828 RepID=A0A516PXG0_9ACTN|nr:mechanosensitive ion channel domain-containing protein [Microlunatus elymi]QDP95869.1 mechanosensitive ion channel [Microlunatus elymi]